ncbi:hypothetical protein SAMD00019534_100030 [Acytostelium subglobosum LB1]|uniref:hypothetical protein n=1 Tax=Acytostelium subglobosum LB1 TaxID=1410327 RepID=UPI0006447D81|nr:hypothetical protein SAMD00019534_100030 [Acytostelium subglobosum LB1]GAM26828.1 hypothetical protein SAMD00019534_100030 [Acytostelium subglobosum LB1]|eukprot:XP_012750096.1 hypothetical protein SAMD00019534_100030 [Acytostelium subglobosum LB1]
MIRPSLAPNNKITIVEDRSDNTIGAFSSTVREDRINGQLRHSHYGFDINMLEKFRNGGMAMTIFEKMIRGFLEKDGSLCYGSSLKTAANVVNRKMDQIGVRHYCDQHQHAWAVDFPVPLEAVPNNVQLKIWEEEDKALTKKRWDDYFKDWNFVPNNFNEILEYNKKYCYKTYMARLERDGHVSEASISVWNQDLIFTLSSQMPATMHRVQSHRQIFSCYTYGDDKDFLFNYLLRYVHNKQYQEGVEFLFIGLSELDPINRYVPLLRGIQSLTFSFIVGAKAKEDYESLWSVASKVPVYNDPRDYGVLMLIKEFVSSL